MALQDNKYLTLRLSEEHYAIPILKIKEIIGMMPVTKVPRLPNHFKGVINLRGKIIPVIDLRLKFGLEEKEYDERTSIIVIELAAKNGLTTSGIVVDTVQEVMDIAPGDIEPPPKHGSEAGNAFLTGMGKIGEKVVMVLDAEKILTSNGEKELEKI